MQCFGEFETRPEHSEAAGRPFPKCFQLAEIKSERAFLTKRLNACELFAVPDGIDRPRDHSRTEHESWKNLGKAEEVERESSKAAAQAGGQLAGAKNPKEIPVLRTIQTINISESLRTNYMRRPLPLFFPLSACCTVPSRGPMSACPRSSRSQWFSTGDGTASLGTADPGEKVGRLPRKGIPVTQRRARMGSGLVKLAPIARRNHALTMSVTGKNALSSKTCCG